MTTYESALSELSSRLTGTDASLTTSLADILAAALQELIEAELTARIGAAPGERTETRRRVRRGGDSTWPSERPSRSNSVTTPYRRRAC